MDTLYNQEIDNYLFGMYWAEWVALVGGFIHLTGRFVSSFSVEDRNTPWLNSTVVSF